MPKRKKHPASPGEVSKTQAVRVMDVLIIGPLMMLGGAALRQTQPVLGSGLMLFGVTTTVYNARNFTRANEAMQKK
jgi:hypothetical protein